MHRYLAEFDFRYSNRMALGINDEERTEIAIRGIIGKRLTYRTNSWRSQRNPIGLDRSSWKRHIGSLYN